MRTNDPRQCLNLVPVIALLVFCALPRIAAGATLKELKSTAGQLFAVHKKMASDDGTGLRVLAIKSDHAKAHGYAAIHWHRTTATIYVDPKKLAEKSVNTWAFVLAHELAHHILNHNGTCNPPASPACKQREFAADRAGAEIAQQARFNLWNFVSDMLTDDNQCSLSHGCWHQRALQLAIDSSMKVDRSKVPNCNHG